MIGQAGFKIGLCWQGSLNRTDPGRFFRLGDLAPVLQIPEVRLFSLQKGPGSEQMSELAPGMVESLERLDDDGDAFVDTAAVMEHLDLAITADTAFAHLAGALGRPMWVALKHVPDWRWGLTGSTTPWYPTARLFRQPERGRWDLVFAAIREALLAQFSADELDGPRFNTLA